MNLVINAIISVFNFQTILCIFFGTAIGIIFGAIPGFTGVMAIAIILPFTFSLSPVSGIVMLFSCFCGGCFGGSIAAILIGTPGAPEAAATAKDGYRLALNGKSYKAISMAVFASCFGGMVSAVLLMLFAPSIAELTLLFAPPEYFVLGIFGISVIAGLNEGNILICICAGLVGILFSMVGMDPQSGIQRFTFGNLKLYSGFSLAAIILGAFALNRIFSGFEKKKEKTEVEKEEVALNRDKLTLQEYRDCALPILRGTAIGLVIGAIPAAGAAIAAFISYNFEKVFSKKRDLIGTGILEGVAAPEAANNAVTGTSLIPLLAMGIPGSGGAAALLGAFMMHGLAPGPFLFKNNPDTMYAIMMGFVFANLMLFIIVKLLIRGFIQVTKIPEACLITVLFVICLAGAYCGNASWFDMLVAIVSGIIFYFLSKIGIPTIPFILGFILGPTIETNYRKSLIMSNGSPSIFFTRPICIVLFLLTIAIIFGTKFMNRGAKKDL